MQELDTGMKTTAIIPAAGRGTRMQSDVAKQYMELRGKPVLYHTLKAFEESRVDSIVLVVGAGEEETVQKEIVEAYGFRKVQRIVAGGAERFLSVYQGLLAAEGSGFVLIHDAARPLVSQELIERTLAAVQKYKACIPGIPAKDTIKRADKAGNVQETLKRGELVAVQTPQAFDYPLLLEAYRELLSLPQEQLQNAMAQITDDASLVERLQTVPVKIIPGEERNFKLTTPMDLLLADIILEK